MSIPAPAISRAAREQRTGTDRLIGYLDAYRAVAVTMGVTVLAIWVVDRHVAVLAVAAAAAVQAIAITVARRWAAEGRPAPAVVLINAFVWPLTILGAVVAPRSLPISSMSCLPAALIAVAQLDRRPARSLMIGAGVVTAIVTVVSLTTDVTGVSDLVADGIETAVLITLTPALGALVSIIGWQSHQRLSERAAELAASRRRLLLAADDERRRVEEQVHDTAGRRIERAVDLLDRSADREPAAAAEAVGAAHHELQQAITDLRRVVMRLRPAALSEHGLEAALPGAVTLFTSNPVRLDLQGLRRYGDTVEGAVWFACVEAIDAVAAAAARAGSDGSAELSLVDSGAAVTLEASGGATHGTGAPGAPDAPETAAAAALIQALDDRLAPVDGWAEGGLHGGRLTIRAVVPVADHR